MVFLGLEKGGRHKVLGRKTFLIDKRRMYIPLSAAQEVAIWYNGTVCTIIQKQALSKPMPYRLLPLFVLSAKRAPMYTY